MKFLLATLALISFNALAQDNAVRFNVGSLASGLSYVKENLDFEGGEATETEKYHIAVGYLRHVGYNFQVVGNISYQFENIKEGSEEYEDNLTTAELGVLYNIGKDLKSSFYVGALYYHSERFQGSYVEVGEDYTEAESEGSVNGVELTIGKRFNLVENLSYVISVDYITGLSFGGDYEDGYEGGSITRINLATFEYYF